MNERIDQIADQVMDEFGNEFKDRDSGIVVSDEFFERFAQLIAADIAELCADIDGGENMFSRAIRKEYGVE